MRGVLVRVAIVALALGTGGCALAVRASNPPRSIPAAATAPPTVDAPPVTIPATVPPAPPATSSSVPPPTSGTVSPPPTQGPTTTVAPTTAAPTPPPPAAIDWTDIDNAIKWAVAKHNLNGAGVVLVDAERGVIGDRYWGEFNADRVSLVASSTKMITATVILGLATDGVIDLDAPIANQVSWTGGNPTITFAEMISSQSGLMGLVPDQSYAPYACQWSSDASLVDCARQIDTTVDDDRDTVPPRTQFRYGGGQWQLAGGAASDISGMSWSQLVDKYLVQPCGLTSLGYTNQWAAFGKGFDYPSAQFGGDPATLPATENPSMEGGVFIDPIDYAKLIQLHLNGGSCNGNQVVDTVLLTRAHSNQLPRGAGQYGFGWFIEPNGTVTDPGAYGSIAWLDLANGKGAWLVIESTTTVGGEMITDLQPLFRAALANA